MLYVWRKSQIKNVSASHTEHVYGRERRVGSIGLAWTNLKGKVDMKGYLRTWISGAALGALLLGSAGAYAASGAAKDMGDRVSDGAEAGESASASGASAGPAAGGINVAGLAALGIVGIVALGVAVNEDDEQRTTTPSSTTTTSTTTTTTTATSTTGT